MIAEMIRCCQYEKAIELEYGKAARATEAIAEDYRGETTMMKNALIALGIALAVIVQGTVHGQTYPNRPVRYICPFPPGDGIDIITRIIAIKLGEIWGRQIIVDNRPGAGGTVGADLAAKATPDGYTLLMGTTATHAIDPALYKKLPYDHIKGFAPVSLIGRSPNVLVVIPSVPARSLGEFITYAKANPGRVSYGSAGVGTTLHLSMEMFRSMTGIDVVHVPYKGGAPALSDLLSGNIQSMFGALPLVLPHIKLGKVRALGVTTAMRSTQLPDVPTVAESGYPGFEVALWSAMFVPAAVPNSIVAKLNADLVKILRLPGTIQRLAENGVDASPSTPDQLAAFVKAETVKWARAVKISGAAVD